LYIIPKSAEDGCPLTVSSKTVRGAGSFTDDSECFECTSYIPYAHI